MSLQWVCNESASTLCHMGWLYSPSVPGTFSEHCQVTRRTVKRPRQHPEEAGFAEGIKKSWEKHSKARGEQPWVVRVAVRLALPCSAWSSRRYIAVILWHPLSFSGFQESLVTGAAIRVIFTCQVLVSTLPAPVAKPMPWSQPNAWPVMQSGQVEQALAPF